NGTSIPSHRRFCAGASPSPSISLSFPPFSFPLFFKKKGWPKTRPPAVLNRTTTISRLDGENLFHAETYGGRKGRVGNHTDTLIVKPETPRPVHIESSRSQSRVVRLAQPQDW